ncbi:MAG: hypothetical protein E7307_01565 [Butyrivibrio sp.]|nr:hypothetical protein [Butyrivibrio sp.]
MSEQIELMDYQKLAIYDEADGLLPRSIAFLKSEIRQRLIILKAITGSGKTCIAAKYIEELLESKEDIRLSKNLCVIWLSKGNANLHIQSGNKLKEYIKAKDIVINNIEDSADFIAERFNDKDVYVVNWEKLNNIDKETGELSNNLFARSDERNFSSAIKNSEDVDFIFVIDEFHTNYDTESYRKIVNLFNPHFILGMSATPSLKQLSEANHKYVIKVADVIAEHMIKKGICFNTIKDFDESAIDRYDSIDEFFLRIALEQRDRLEAKYRKAQSNVTPLLLVQFDDDKNNTDIIRIKNILDKKYSENANNDYAIWISETDNKKDKLRSDDIVIKNLSKNEVKVLLFKQAVATGWDCPRAHILLRYRRVVTRKDTDEVSSFDIQTIGRIFRMPEHIHYADDDLNYGYVYVPSENYELSNEFDRAFEDEKDAFITREKPLVVATEIDTATNFEARMAAYNKQTVQEKAFDEKVEEKANNKESVTDFEQSDSKLETGPLGNEDQEDVVVSEEVTAEGASGFSSDIVRIEDALSGQNRIAKNKGPSVEDLKKEIKEIVDKNVVKKKNVQNFSSGIEFRGKTIELDDSLLDTDNKAVLKSNESKFSIADTPALLNDKANAIIKKLILMKHYPEPAKSQIKRSIIAKFSSLITDDKANMDEATIEARSKMIIQNEAFLKQIIRDVDDFIKSSSTYEFEESDFVFDRNPKYSTVEDTASKQLQHMPLPENASGPEKIFERLLNASDKVSFWYKNPDSGEKAFCVPYDVEVVIRGKIVKSKAPTYPDFIVSFKDGSVGFYEIKDVDKDEAVNDKKDIAIRNKVSQLNRDIKGMTFYGALLDIDQFTETVRDIENFPELGF